MKMTDHQRRLWQSMMDEIQHYLDGETEDFYVLVGKLGGALDASDIKKSRKLLDNSKIEGTLFHVIDILVLLYKQQKVATIGKFSELKLA